MLCQLTVVCVSVNSNDIKKVRRILGLVLFCALPCHGYTQGKMVWAQSITECQAFSSVVRIGSPRHTHQQGGWAGGGGQKFEMNANIGT